MTPSQLAIAFCRTRKFIADNGVDIDKQITQSFKLSEAAAAYEKFDQQNMGKGMIIPD